MPVWTDPNLSKSSLVRTLHDWWTSSCRPSGLPDRTDFDLPTHRLLLPNVMIAEVEEEPFRIRYRLVGTRVVGNLGIDFTGRYLDDLIGAGYAVPWPDYYRQAYCERQPVLGAVTEPTKAGDTFTYEFGLFPITRGGTTVQQFVALEDYFNFTLTSGALAGL